MNKIYRSLFSVKGIVELVHSAGSVDTEEGPTVKSSGCGIAFASQDTLSLDAFVTRLGGREPQSVGHLRLAAQTFGAWDAGLCAEADRSGMKIILS